MLHRNKTRTIAFFPIFLHFSCKNAQICLHLKKSRFSRLRKNKEVGGQKAKMLEESQAIVTLIWPIMQTVPRKLVDCLLCRPIPTSIFRKISEQPLHSIDIVIDIKAKQSDED